MSTARQNFNEETEAEMNKMINMELYASYVYMSMSSHFDKDDVALPNLSSYFKKSSNARRDQALALITYQNKRGGRLVFQDIKAPSQIEWSSHTQALEDTLALERTINEGFLKVVDIAEKHHDEDSEDFIQDEFLMKSVQILKDVAGLIENSKRCDGGVGTFIFDHELDS